MGAPAIHCSACCCLAGQSPCLRTPLGGCLCWHTLLSLVAVTVGPPTSDQPSTQPSGWHAVLLSACSLLRIVLQYCVTIHWPTSWLATRGYTSFTLGFETMEEAAQWHALVQRQLSMLRVRAASSKGDSSAGHSSKPSYDEGLGSRAAGSGNGTVGRKTSQVGWSRPQVADGPGHAAHTYRQKVSRCAAASTGASRAAP